MLTLDTNSLINLLDERTETATSVDQIRALFALEVDGAVSMAITTRVAADIGRDTNATRRLKMIAKLDGLPVIGTIGRVGVTTVGSGDVAAGDDLVELEQQVGQILTPGGVSMADKRAPNKLADRDHLVGHAMSRRDIFVTDDGGILGKGHALRDRLGITVMNPTQALAFVLERLRDA